MIRDPVQAYLDALDEWGMALVTLHVGPTSGAERAHHEEMLKRCRANLELTLRHLLAYPTSTPAPRRASSVRMPAIEIPADKDEKDRR